jgi:hypothetical protein
MVPAGEAIAESGAVLLADLHAPPDVVGRVFSTVE